MPVLGVIFLRHAANRFDAAHRQIEVDQASGKMPKGKILPADYAARRSLYLPESARYETIMRQLSVTGANLPTLVTQGMTDIETKFEPLLGVLPKYYGIFGPKVLEEGIRLFNSEQIKQATGDGFGRIYECPAGSEFRPLLDRRRSFRRAAPGEIRIENLQRIGAGHRP
jgi:type I restriction enzyme M protein